MIPHVHLDALAPWSPWRETIHRGALVASLDDEGRGILTPARVTVRRRVCLVCGRLDEVTTRDGRRWRRTTRPTPWTPPTVDELQQLVDLALAHGWDGTQQ